MDALFCTIRRDSILGLFLWTCIYKVPSNTQPFLLLDNTELKAANSSDNVYPVCEGKKVKELSS